MTEVLENLANELMRFSGKLIIAVLIIVIGFKFTKFLLNHIKKGRGFQKLEKSTQTFIYSILNILFKGLVLLTAVAELGIPMTSIVAVLGSFGLALGLALQGGLSNIAGGVMIMIFKPFKVGDFIDTHDDSGTVKEINIFNTILNTYDNRVVIIPNGTLSNSVIINYSSMKKRLLDLEVAVDYKNSVTKVKEILLQIAKNSKYLVKDDNILVAIKEYRNNSLIFTLQIWVLKDDYSKAKYEIFEEIKKQFDKEKITTEKSLLDILTNNSNYKK